MRWTPPPYDPDKELRAHLPTSDWRRAIEEICSRHGIDALEASPFESGSDAVWAAGGRVVKLTAPPWSWQIDAEARFLGLVRGKLSVETPAVLARGDLQGWPYIVMSRVPGVALGSVWSDLDGATRLTLAEELGHLVRQLHSLRVAEEPEAWRAFWLECRERVDQGLGKDVPPELSGQVPPFLRRVGTDPGLPHVLLHTELLDQHVFVEQRQGRLELSGLIDFADARIGPPEYDFPALVEFIFKGEPGLFRAFLLAYGYRPKDLTQSCSNRMLAWGLRHRYGSLSRMLGIVGPDSVEDLPQLANTLYGVRSDSRKPS